MSTTHVATKLAEILHGLDTSIGARAVLVHGRWSVFVSWPDGSGAEEHVVFMSSRTPERVDCCRLALAGSRMVIPPGVFSPMISSTRETNEATAEIRSMYASMKPLRARTVWENEGAALRKRCADIVSHVKAYREYRARKEKAQAAVDALTELGLSASIYGGKVCIEVLLSPEDAVAVGPVIAGMVKVKEATGA